MISNTRRRNVISAITCTALVAAGGLVASAPAQASESYEECMARTQGIETWGCYDLQVAPSSGQTAAVKLTWTLNTSAEGFNNGDWKGGYMMHRWPVQGQWKKYPPLRRVDLPAGADKCTGSSISATTCYGLFGGASGEQIIEFGPKMAGFVYEIVSSDYICSTDQSSCGPSGGVADRYVFVLRASRYTNKKGETVTSLKCPPAKSRSSSCSRVLTAKVVNNIGGGEPVPLP